MAGRMGGKRVTQGGLTVHERRRRAEPAAGQGRRARARRTARRDQGGREPWPRLRLPCSAGRRRRASRSRRRVFGAEVKPHLVHETVRAELDARRAGTRAAKTRGLVAGGRAKPWRQKGTGRARAGHDPRAAVDRRRRRVPADAAQLRRQGQPQGRARRRCAARSRRTRGAARSACSTAPAFDAPSTKAARRAARRLGQGAARCVVVVQPDEEALIKSFRNLERVGRHGSGELEVAARRLGPLAARHRGARCAAASRGRAAVSLHPNQVLLAPVVSEKSYELIERRQVHVPRPSGRAQDADPPGRRGAVRASACRP